MSMIKLTISLMLILLIIGCQNDNIINTPNLSDNSGIDVQEQLLRPLLDCCNNNFPDNNTTVMSFEECPESGENVNYPRYDCALLWAEYVTDPNSSLGYSACNEPLPDNVPNINSIQKSQQNNHPYFTWDFLFSHFYYVEKKIDNGQWNIIATIENCADGENSVSCGDPNTLNYTDTSVDINTIQNNIYYRIRAKIYNNVSPGGTTIVYTPVPLSVNITGVTQLTTIQTGEFTAVAEGGVPPYTYTWSKYQYCDGIGPESSDHGIGIEEISCGSWRSLPFTTATINVGGFVPGFKLKVTVNDQNNSDIDYHVVDVYLP